VLLESIIPTTQKEENSQRPLQFSIPTIGDGKAMSVVAVICPDDGIGEGLCLNAVLLFIRFRSDWTPQSHQASGTISKMRPSADNVVAILRSALIGLTDEPISARLC
jgi:hypothetical protein